MKHEQKSVVMDGDTAAAYISYAFFHHAEKAIATCKSPPAIWRRKQGAPSPCAEGLFLSRIPWAFHIQKAARCLNTVGRFLLFAGEIYSTPSRRSSSRILASSSTVALGMGKVPVLLATTPRSLQASLMTGRKGLRTA